MALLSLDFQEGFKGDQVVIQLDGQEVFSKDDVKTKLTLGYAGHHKIEIPPGEHTLSILMPGRNTYATIDLPAADQLYVGVSVRGTELVPIVSEKPFGYA